MRFQAYFTPIIKVILWIMSILSVAGIVVAILIFANVHIGELTYGQATLLISVCPITAIVATLFATLHYKVDENCLRLYVGPFDILRGKVQIEKILNIVIDGHNMYISYLSEGMDPIIAAIVINRKRFGEMKDLLMSKNGNIVFYEENNEIDNSK